ncbi:DUF6527 family protein [Variovorax sp. WS11]|uniref:DUF6527 family protein n=1 Tax=Variovorax sp. WS11 TaxID=1105204 RepID=UPI0035BFA730
MAATDAPGSRLRSTNACLSSSLCLRRVSLPEVTRLSMCARTGCGQQVVLNLMESHHPSWRVVSEEQGPSIFPSVDSTTCGAHLLVRDGRIIWC